MYTIKFVVVAFIFAISSAYAGEAEDALLLSSVAELDIRGVERSLRLGAKISTAEKGQRESLIYRAVDAMSNHVSDSIHAAARSGVKKTRAEIDKMDRQFVAEAEQRVMPVLVRLLRDGARHWRGEAILREPIQVGALRVMRILIEHAADPHGRIGGYSAAAFATKYDQLSAYKLLVSFGAKALSPQEAAQLSMTHAAQTLDTEKIERALREGATINGSDTCGMTPLVAALSNPFTRDVQVEKIDWFIAQGAAPNDAVVDCGDAHGRTPLHALFSWPMIGDGSEKMNAYDLNSAYIALKLIASGADVNIKDKKGNTALHLAVSSNLLYAVRFLIDKGASIDTPDAHGVTAIKLARSAEMTNLLLRRTQ